MTPAKEPLLHDDHFRAFGAIVHQFARFEAIMVGIMCKVSNLDSVYGGVFTSELPYRGKKDTLAAILDLRKVPAEQIEKLNGYLGQVHKWNSLRNAIAHNVWKPGRRPGSVMPFGLSVRNRDQIFVGYEEKDRDYTAEELLQIGNELISLHDRFVRYLKGVNLLPTAAPDDGAE